MTNETADKFSPGTLIDGRYDIRAHLGQGGMGSVYRAHDTKVGQMVALKMMTEGGGDSAQEGRRMRFAREIVAINGVRHPNVLHIQEFGFHKDTPYMVMELLEGRDLATLLKESRRPLDVEHAADIILAVCAAIRACHASQIIHRDLKPSNIMIVPTDAGAGWDVKVVDFGISKTIGTSNITQTGRVMGTPHFLAPEQLAGKAGPASDQYAIGVLLYVCLTRRNPFSGLEGMRLVRAIERGVFAGPREHRPELPEELERIILRAMQVNPARRYDSVFELGRALWKFASPMGRQIWKRYYETPPVERHREEDMSVLAVPLVQRMAEGKIDLTEATVVAHYEGTTAGVVRDSQTVAVEADAMTELTLQTPTCWHWESSGAQDAAPDGGEFDFEAPPAPAPSRSRAARSLARALMIAAVAAFVAVAAIAAGRFAGAPAPVESAPPPPAVTENAPPAPVPPPAPAPVADAARVEKPAPKPVHRARRHTQVRHPTLNPGWLVDPDGYLIPSL